MTVGELMDVLTNYDKDTKVWIAVGRNIYETEVAINISKIDWEISDSGLVICGNKKG